MTGQLMALRTASRLRWLWLIASAAALCLGLGLSHGPAHSDRPGPSALILAATSVTPTPTSVPAPGESGQGPTPIQVGPPLPAPPAPAAGSGGTVAGGSAPSPGLFDITGHITAAIDSWFRDLVTAALDPVLGLLGHTLLATPDVTGQDRVGGLWQMTAGIADGFLVLFLLVGAAIVMGHETLQTRTAAKDVLPRVVVAAVAVNASLGLAGLAIAAADSLSEALLGQGVGPAQASVVLRQLVLGSLAGGGIFTVLVGGTVAVLAVMLVCTWIVRVAVTVILVVAAPVALVCHALPQTEGMARWWWRAFAATVGTQVAQSLVLVTALRVFLATGGPPNLGLASTGGLVDLLVCACLCWVLVKIPFWTSHLVFTSRSRGGVGRVVRDVVIYKGVKALAAGAGL
jgi:hypothetical protein